MKVKTNIKAGIINFNTGTVNGGAGGGGAGNGGALSGVSIGIGGNSGGTVG